MDVFTRLMKLTDRREDFFTECLAATLQHDQDLARNYVRVLKPNVDLDDNTEIQIRTQVDCSGAPIPMLLQIGNDSTIATIHELDSAGQVGRVSEYLAVDAVDDLAYITGHPLQQPLDPSLIMRGNYLHPNNRDHFLWSDLYLTIRNACRRSPDAVLPAGFTHLLETFGYIPPAPRLDDMHNESNQRDFARLWEPTKIALRAMGWSKFTAGTRAELYVQDGNSPAIDWIWLDPIWSPGKLRIRITPKAPATVDILQQAMLRENPDLTTEKSEAKRQDGKVDVLDVLIPFNDLFGSQSTAAQMADALQDAVNDLGSGN